MRLRGRLFWKILLGFWLIFLLITQGLWVGFILYGNRHEPPEESIARRFINLQMTSAESALKAGGLPALHALMASWPDGEQALLTVRAPSAAADEPGPVTGDNSSLAGNGTRPLAGTGAGDIDHGATPGVGRRDPRRWRGWNSSLTGRLRRPMGSNICCIMTLKTYAGCITTATGATFSICRARCSGWA